MLVKFGVVFALSSILAIGSPLAEQVPAGKQGVLYLPKKVIWQIEAGEEAFVDLAVGKIFEISRDGKVTVEAIERWERYRLAAQRGYELIQLLPYDLNGDWKIEASEIHEASEYVRANEVALMWTKFFKADANSDDALTFKELNDYAAERAAELQESLHSRPIKIDWMLFDIDGDGVASIKEVRRVASSLHGARDLEILPILTK